MTLKIAFCGLDCSTCEAYLATQAKDEAEKERIAANWREFYQAPGITAAYVTCDGCTNLEGHAGGHCLECDIRACAIARQVANCAHCAEYEGCAKLERFFGFVPAAKATLDEVRRGL
ncbi:MAG TPA: DUF3795 domain-containing protein [Anaerolineae bacterium]|nr:DUF3795 domain-containing protein [Anaerolineae bacterium]HOQ97978.1 DUF3795 domain-containing protein [Anaerolineae bacterium]HPL27484.1 DUF3795 domain-containing protein [Anaerolineae bacterium]